MCVHVTRSILARVWALMLCCAAPAVLMGSLRLEAPLLAALPLPLTPASPAKAAPPDAPPSTLLGLVSPPSTLTGVPSLVDDSDVLMDSLTAPIDCVTVPMHNGQVAAEQLHDGDPSGEAVEQGEGATQEELTAPSPLPPTKHPPPSRSRLSDALSTSGEALCKAWVA